MQRQPQLFALSNEQQRQYETAVSSVREYLQNGFTYVQACARLNEIDPWFKEFFTRDFLKILIAEEHLANDMPLGELSLLLGVSFEQLHQALSELIEEINAELSWNMHSFPSDDSLFVH